MEKRGEQRRKKEGLRVWKSVAGRGQVMIPREFFYVYAVYVHTVEGQPQINGASSSLDGVAWCVGACRVSPVTPVLAVIHPQYRDSVRSTIMWHFPISYSCPGCTGMSSQSTGDCEWRAWWRDCQDLRTLFTAVDYNPDRTKRY
jgi:hypothetical protein